MRSKKKTTALTVGAALTLTLSAAPVFSATPLANGFLVATHAETKSKDAKCGAESKAKDGKCGGDKKMKDGKCGEGKCGADKKMKDGKCGAESAKKMKDGKCGEGTCGGKK